MTLRGIWRPDRRGASVSGWHRFEELDEALAVGGLVVVHRHVAARRAIQIPAGREALGHVLHVGGIQGVVAGADHECRYLNGSEIVEPIPVAKRGLRADAELTRTLHRHVDGLVEMTEGTVDGVGP